MTVTPLQILLHVLTACITLALAMMMGLGQPTQVTHARVVEIDSEQVLRRFVNELGEIDDELIQSRSTDFMDAMQTTLQSYAARNGVIVVEARLAVAGAADITDRAYAEVATLTGLVEVSQ